ncbi:hypothetical protein A4U53_039740 (plasmid) [Rhizobium ruizarguesonis]|uniref:Uncharacterized protein n=1 Tax=Rhizobium ruizarguesonis TaxID=2081791 RepID=A0ACD5EXF5_9HYPH
MKISTFLGSVALLSIATAFSAHAADRVIAGIVFQQDQFFRTIQIGMEAAAKKRAWSFSEQTATTSRKKSKALSIPTFPERWMPSSSRR